MSQQPAWQPIETAPKDNTAVLLWSRHFDKTNGGVMVGRYCDYGDTRSHWSPFIPCEWTHWMPLPEPPDGQ